MASGAKTNTVRITPEGGIAVLMTAGETLVPGNVIEVDATATDTVIRCPASSDRPIGVVYASATASASVWVVVAGITDVLFDTSTTPARNLYHCYVTTVATEPGVISGSTTVNTARHWGEIGHCLEAKGSPGVLAKCVLHFN